MQLLGRRNVGFLISVLGILVFTYVALRTYYVPITIDEAITFFLYVLKGHWLPEPSYWTANNHPLNSLLAIWSSSVYGNDEWSLRLPNLLALAIYMVYAALWSSRIRQPEIRLALFLGLTCGQYILDYFGLCRGYGLSLAFLLGSWYHLANCWRRADLLDIAASSIFGGLAVASNLTTIPIQTLGMLLMVVSIAISDKLVGFRRLGGFWLSAILALIPLAYFADTGLMLKEGGHLYYGSDGSFWQTTVKTLIEGVFDTWADKLTVLLPLILSAFCLAAGMHLIQSGKSFLRSELFVLLFLLFGTVCGQMFQHHFFGMNYASDRVGLYYVPLVILIIGLVASGANSKMVRLLMVPSLIVVVLIPVNLLCSLNFSYTRNWKFEAGSKQFFEQTLRYKDVTGQKPIVSGYYHQEHSYNYYNFLNGWPLYAMIPEVYGTDIPDLQYESPDLYNTFSSYHSVFQNRTSGLRLYENNSLHRRQLIHEEELNPLSEAGEYFNLISMTLDTLYPANILFDFQISLKMRRDLSKVWVVFDVLDKEYKSITYQTIKLDETGASWTNGDMFCGGAVYGGSVKPGAFVKLYIWNIDQEFLQVNSANVKTYLLY